MAVYFTSDTHIGHANAIKFTNRPFETIEQMNEALIQNINETVKPTDTLYILGDFAYKIPRDEAVAWAKKIHCQNVHLLKGNHDKDYTGTDAFSSVSDYLEVKLNNKKLALFHYPIAEWNGARYDWGVHLHGHIHSDGSYNAENAKQGRHIYDVGVDANEFKPVLLEDILAFMGFGEVGE